MRRIKYVLIPSLVIAAMLLTMAASCDTDNVSAKSDETVCVFDGSERGSQKLKFQIFPGEEPKHADGDDEVVRIPTSNRFYAAFENREIADAGAPTHYLGYAKGNTAVFVQGQFKFRFNTERACEWYAKHGRRNAGDDGLGFNARSDESASDFTPWIRFLNENFGTVAGQTIKAETTSYSWPELVYGNDAEGVKRSEPVDLDYGKHIGRIFTERLNRSLGGQFFCGTDVSVWGDDENIDQDCPPILFDTGPIETKDAELMKRRSETEALRAQLETQALEAEIRSNRLAAQLKDEKTKQRLAREQAVTARLQTQADKRYQTCVAMAKLNFDCDGHKFPTYVIGGGSLPSAP